MGSLVAVKFVNERIARKTVLNGLYTATIPKPAKA